MREGCGLLLINILNALEDWLLQVWTSLWTERQGPSMSKEDGAVSLLFGSNAAKWSHHWLLGILMRGYSR